MRKKMRRLALMRSATPSSKSPGHTLLLAIWLLPSACLVGFLGAGIAVDAPSAYLAFGFLPASVLAVVAVAASYWVRRGTETVARWVWISHCLALLGFLVIMAATVSRNAGMALTTVLTYTMLISGFPGSTLLMLVMAGVTWALDYVRQPALGNSINHGGIVDVGFVVLVWFAYFVLGYWQWFRILPKLVSRFYTRPQ
jgi:hypothetical protein